VVDAVVKDRSGAGLGVDEEVVRREGWIQEVTGRFEKCRLWRGVYIFRVFGIEGVAADVGRALQGGFVCGG
jgi:hypothetical protein